jgi:hypothetical protein
MRRALLALLLAGCKINFDPVYDAPGDDDGTATGDAELCQGDCRARLGAS